MKIGVTLPTGSDEGEDGTPRWPETLRYARHAEELGFDSVWLADHLLFRFPGEPTTGIHEAGSFLAALAATTSRVELGPMVMCTSFRNPAVLAKMAAAIDDISGGRFILGVGCGWHDPEYAAYGFPIDHRVSRFEEALRILAPLVRGESVTFDGRYHAVQDVVLVPPPERRIPVLIAAKQPRMFRLTARHADAWNTAWYGFPDDRMSSSLELLRDAMEAERRDPATLAMTVGIMARDPDTSTPEDARPIALSGSVDELARALDAHAALGFEHLIAWLVPKTRRSLDRLAEAVRLHRAGAVEQTASR
jgi:probable F420-dependent oxidoreductase